MKPLCELEERHGVDLGQGDKNVQACAPFVDYIAIKPFIYVRVWLVLVWSKSVMFWHYVRATWTSYQEHWCMYVCMYVRMYACMYGLEFITLTRNHSLESNGWGYRVPLRAPCQEINYWAPHLHINYYNSLQSLAPKRTAITEVVSLLWPNNSTHTCSGTQKAI